MSSADHKKATRATTRYASSLGSLYMYFEYKQPGVLLGYRNDFVVQHFPCGPATLKVFLDAPISLRGVRFQQITGKLSDCPSSKLNAWDVEPVLSKMNKTLLLPSSSTSQYEYFSAWHLCVTGYHKGDKLRAFCQPKDVMNFARTDLADRDKAFAYLLHGATRMS
jgi:hypothetical protein